MGYFVPHLDILTFPLSRDELDDRVTECLISTSRTMGPIIQCICTRRANRGGQLCVRVNLVFRLIGVQRIISIEFFFLMTLLGFVRVTYINFQKTFLGLNASTVEPGPSLHRHWWHKKLANKIEPAVSNRRVFFFNLRYSRLFWKRSSDTTTWSWRQILLRIEKAISTFFIARLPRIYLRLRPLMSRRAS